MSSTTGQASQPGSLYESSLKRNGSVPATVAPPLSLSTSIALPAPVNKSTTDVFSPVTTQVPYALTPIGKPPAFEPQNSSLSTISDSERVPSSLGNGTAFPGLGAMGVGQVGILLQNLPRNMTDESVRSMLLFAQDLLSTTVLKKSPADEGDFVSAIAFFKTRIAAEEVRDMLDGKWNPTSKANMVVELLDTPAMLHRRNTIDLIPSSSSLNSLSLVTPSGLMAQPLLSRFDQAAGPSGTVSHSDLQSPDQASRLQSLFSSQSPLSDGLNGRPRVTGKSVIDQEVDEDTGELLKDPIAYARNGHSNSMGMPRRSTNPPMGLGHFGSLSLSTNLSSPSLSFGNGSSTRPTPSSAISPNFPNLGANGYHQPPPFHRPNYPPVNPADQNPPCNTLYVGNLPPDTSEDELKALFSKQRGYKRMIFRQKANGPICFVEFDDISWATKSLKELYGYELSNSIKGGIRLSFSKNPLGVRNSQAGNMHSPNPMTPHSAMNAMNGPGLIGTPRFSTANGPPPGLNAPPGLPMPIGMTPNSIPSPHPTSGGNGGTTNNGFGSNGGALGLGISHAGSGGNRMRRPPPPSSLNDTLIGNPASGPALGAMNGAGYPDYMMGR